MTTLAADKPLTIVTGDFNSVGIIADDIVYEGAMVGDNASGYGRPLVAGDPFLGHSLVQVDNTGGAAGAKNIRLRTGRYRGKCTISGVLITDVGKEVYASDDDTYTLSSYGNSRVGMIIMYVTTNTAIVEFQTNEIDVSFKDLYVHGTTQLYPVGYRREVWDGRVFYYAKATNIISSCKFGVKFYGQIGDGIATTLYQNQAVGDRTITIAAASVSANDFRGGYVMIHADTHQQFRGIISNTATDGSGNITITLDAPLAAIVTTSHYTEVLQNPYGNVRLTAGPSGGMSGNPFTTVAGIPNVITTEPNEFLFLQTWGPIWINPHGSSLQDAGITGGERKLVFDCEGSICIEDDVAHGPCIDGDEHQLAGCIIDRNASGVSGPPLVLLKVSR